MNTLPVTKESPAAELVRLIAAVLLLIATAMKVLTFPAVPAEISVIDGTARMKGNGCACQKFAAPEDSDPRMFTGIV